MPRVCTRRPPRRGVCRRPRLSRTGLGRSVGRRATARDWAAVGPVMANANPRSVTSWANLLIEYAPWLEPSAGGEREHLPGHNGSYKRATALGIRRPARSDARCGERPALGFAREGLPTLPRTAGAHVSPEFLRALPSLRCASTADGSLLRRARARGRVAQGGLSPRLAAHSGGALLAHRARE